MAKIAKKKTKLESSQRNSREVRRTFLIAVVHSEKLSHVRNSVLYWPTFGVSLQ